MTTSKRDSTAFTKDAVPTADFAAAAQAEGSSERATSRLPLLVRIVAFAAATIFTIMGIMGIAQASRTQTAAQSITTSSARPETVRHVLVLMSYDESDANVEVEREGLLGALNKSGISSDVFYLDARAEGDAESLAGEAARIARKASASSGYDSIVCAGDEALSLVLDDQVHFGGIPTTFFAVDDASLASRAHDAGFATGICEQGVAPLALEAAAGIVPGATRAVVLQDGSPEASGLLAQLEAAPQDGADLAREVWDVSALSRDDLGRRLSELGDDAVVLLLAANHDVDGNVYAPSDTAHWLASQTRRPIFSAQGGVGEGVCGAAFVNRRQEGADAAARAVELLNGAAPASLANVVVRPECAVFDVSALAEHGIDADATPPSSALVNEPALSWRTLRPMLLPALYLLLAAICIVVFGVIGFRRSVASRQAIVATNRSLQHRLTHDLLTELPNRQALERFAEDPTSVERMRT
ncbi:MAG: hypothetical protein J6D54_01790, partial [Olsenella sp.]|nr:hypothetical protein [Olsenella sp.]